MKLQDKEIKLRPFVAGDLPRLWQLLYKEESPEWKEWDAPYYKHEAMTYERFLFMQYDYLNQPSRYAITVNDELIGLVSYYYEDEMRKWLEVGIVLYEGQNWGRGIGTRVLNMWIAHIFNTQRDIARVGLTTWSGNVRMMRVAEKLGMTLEARIRSVRYYNGEYYDSIRMGILREEWNAR